MKKNVAASACNKASSPLTVVRTSLRAGSLETHIDQIEEIYLQIDRQTTYFSAATGIRCRDGCGICCRSEKVEASVLEMLPLARALFRSGQINDWAQLIFDEDPGRLCRLFRPDPQTADLGRCRFYPFRPLLCRLFGFAAGVDKRGRPVYSACRVVTTIDPETSSQAAFAVSEGLPVPLFSEFHLRAAMVQPELGNPPVPINQALQQAVQCYGLALEMARASSAESVRPSADSCVDPICGDDSFDDPHGSIPPRLAA